MVIYTQHIVNKMAGKSWWQRLLDDHLDDLSSETGAAIRFNDLFRNSFPSSCSLGRDAWDEIDACTTVPKKVNRLIRTIISRGECGFKGFVYALWKSDQVEAALLLDGHGAWRPKTVVWFCCNEHQAHSVLQCLMRFKTAASNLVPKTIYPDGKETVYCQVQVAFPDFYEEMVRHLFYVVYPENDSVVAMRKCVHDVEQKLQPSLVVHVGTVCSSDMSLTVGDSIVPSSVGGVFLPARVQSTSEYRRFCQRLDTSGVIQEVFKSWTPQNSHSIQLASLVLEQQHQEREVTGRGPFSAGLPPQQQLQVESGPFWLAVEGAGHLGTVNLVTNESDEVSSLVFTPSDSLSHQVEKMAGEACFRPLLQRPLGAQANAHLPQVADGPVSSCAGVQGPICAPDADLALVKEMHAVFGAPPLVCVFCISSLFPGLVDCSSEQHCTEVAAALAVELVGQSLQSSRPRQPMS